MKKITFIFIFICAYTAGNHAQTIVSTNPENKKVVLEEFTGTGCPNCPGGHQQAASILASNPGVVFVVAYHPDNSNYTSTDPMKTNFPAAFYSNPFCHPSSRFMPSAMVNRRDWGSGERIKGTSSWSGNVNTIKAESSPLNVGVSSTYESGTSTLTILVEVYFTANVTDPLTIYCELTEDGIVAAQSGGSSPYTHNHVFREAFVAQWGDAVSTPTTMGTTKTFNFTFDNSTSSYDMTQCEVVAFVRNDSDEEIISGNGAMVGETSTIGLEDIQAEGIKTSVFPNPVNKYSQLNFYLQRADKVEYTIFNMMGQKEYSKDLGYLKPGQYEIPIFGNYLRDKGFYLVNLRVGEEQITEKLIVE